MKKNENFHLPWGRWRKHLLKMKLLILFCLIMTMQLSAKVFSQNERLSLQVKDASLCHVLEEIEKLTDVTFLYRVKEITNVKGIYLNSKNETLEAILKKSLKNTKLKFNIVDKTVVISRMSAAELLARAMEKTKKIKGKVVDKNGNPLPGVSVVIKGAKIGTTTNACGCFIINANKGDVLLFSFVGMKTHELKVGDKNDLKIKLLEEKEKLEEVIVTGFKNVKKSHFTGNVTVVSKKDILKTNSKSIISALQVFDSSLRIKENSKWGSDPNSMPEFNIRGESSIGMEKGLDVELAKQDQRTNLKNNPNLPIFMVDDFEVDVEAIYDMDMNRIENITILKDAAATALYGSRAANGVILIRTVAPKAGELRVNYTFNASVQFPDLSDYNLANSAEKLEAEVAAGLFIGNNPASTIYKQFDYNDKLQKVLSGVNTDWMAQPLQNAINHKHSLFLEGGSETIRYGVDANYDSNKGVMKGSYRDRKGVGFKFEYRFKKLKVRNKVSYSNTSSENSPYGKFSEYALMMPYYRIYDDKGKVIPILGENSATYIDNPMYRTTLDSYDGKSRSDNFTDNLDIDYQITDALRLRTQFSVSKSYKDSESFIDPNDMMFLEYDDLEKGELTERHSENSRTSFKALLSFNKKLDKHFINAVTGFDMSQTSTYNSISTYQGFQIGGMHNSEYAAQEKNKTLTDRDEARLVGFIASANYSYNNIFLLDGSFRYDGSSKFGADKRFAPFWSVGTGVNLHKCKFMENVSFISNLKLRASYGSVGKVNFPSHFAVTTFYFYNDVWSKTGPAAKLYALGNTDLKWETTNTLDGGIDLGFLNGKIKVKATYYDKKTVDLISDLYLRNSTGFTSYKINSGEISNTGYELSINAVALRTKDIILSVYGNLSSNKNEITKLSESMKEYNKAINDNYDQKPKEYEALISTPIQQYHEGASTTAIYAVRSAGIDPSNGKEKFIKRNGMSTYVWCAEDQVVVGDRLPDAQGSFGLNFGYSGFYVNASFLYEWGGQIYNSTIRDKVENVNILKNNVDNRVLSERWREPGDLVPYLDIASARTTRPTSRFVQDNNYVSFNSLSLGYDFRRGFIKKMGLSKMGLRLNMNDIARWSSVKTERGLNYPYARNYSLNLNLSF